MICRRNPCQEVVLWSPQILPSKSGDEIGGDNDINSEQTDMMEEQG